MSGSEDKITSLLSEGRIFEPPAEGRENAFVKSMDEYRDIYQRSMENPEGYWAEQA